MKNIVQANVGDKVVYRGYESTAYGTVKSLLIENQIITAMSVLWDHGTGYLENIDQTIELIKFKKMGNIHKSTGISKITMEDWT